MGCAVLPHLLSGSLPGEESPGEDCWIAELGWVGRTNRRSLRGDSAPDISAPSAGLRKAPDPCDHLDGSSVRSC